MRIGLGLIIGINGAPHERHRHQHERKRHEVTTEATIDLADVTPTVNVPELQTTGPSTDDILQITTESSDIIDKYDLQHAVTVATIANEIESENLPTKASDMNIEKELAELVKTTQQSLTLVANQMEDDVTTAPVVVDEENDQVESEDLSSVTEEAVQEKSPKEPESDQTEEVDSDQDKQEAEPETIPEVESENTEAETETEVQSETEVEAEPEETEAPTENETEETVEAENEDTEVNETIPESVINQLGEGEQETEDQESEKEEQAESEEILTQETEMTNESEETPDQDVVAEEQSESPVSETSNEPVSETANDSIEQEVQNPPVTERSMLSDFAAHFNALDEKAEESMKNDPSEVVLPDDYQPETPLNVANGTGTNSTTNAGAKSPEISEVSQEPSEPSVQELPEKTTSSDDTEAAVAADQEPVTEQSTAEQAAENTAADQEVEQVQTEEQPAPESLTKPESPIVEVPAVEAVSSPETAPVPSSQPAEKVEEPQVEPADIETPKPLAEINLADQIQGFENLTDEQKQLVEQYVKMQLVENNDKEELDLSTEPEQSEERLEEDNDDEEAMPVESEINDIDTNFPTEIEEDDEDDGHIPPDLYGEPEPDEDIAAENSYDYQNSYQDAQKPETADLSWEDSPDSNNAETDSQDYGNEDEDDHEEQYDSLKAQEDDSHYIDHVDENEPVSPFDFGSDDSSGDSVDYIDIIKTIVSDAGSDDITEEPHEEVDSGVELDELIERRKVELHQEKYREMERNEIEESKKSSKGWMVFFGVVGLFFIMVTRRKVRRLMPSSLGSRSGGGGASGQGQREKLTTVSSDRGYGSSNVDPWDWGKSD